MGGALEIYDFLDRYTGICTKKKLPAIPYLVNQLQDAINAGFVDTLTVPETRSNLCVSKALPQIYSKTESMTMSSRPS